MQNFKNAFLPPTENLKTMKMEKSLLAQVARLFLRDAAAVLLLYDLYVWVERKYK